MCWQKSSWIKAHWIGKQDFHLPGRNVNSAARSYTLCGWHTLSDIPLTSLPTSIRAGGRFDILIQIAPGHSPVVKNLNQTVLEPSAEGWFIKIQGVADYEVVGGRQIRVWPAAGAMQKDIEIFLFGPAWSILCHQRGLLPLHASAITTKTGIVAFAGPSGAGKSTTAALMSSLGYRLVTDDILPIGLNGDGAPGAWPYLRRLKLQGSSIAQLALTPAELVSEKLDKERYFVCPKNVADDRWYKLDRVYLLESDSADLRAQIDRVTGADAVHALIKHTYNFDFVPESGLVRNHLALCSQIACKVPVYRLRLSRSLRTREELSSAIRANLEDVAP